MLEEPEAVFAVNILGEGQSELSNRFAWVKDEDRFQLGDWAAAETGAPMLKDALAWLDCRIHARYPAGSHTIYVGEVVASNVPVGRGAAAGLLEPRVPQAPAARGAAGVEAWTRDGHRDTAGPFPAVPALPGPRSPPPPPGTPPRPAAPPRRSRARAPAPPGAGRPRCPPAGPPRRRPRRRSSTAPCRRRGSPPARGRRRRWSAAGRPASPPPSRSPP